jgi:hypothetical protein
MTRLFTLAAVAVAALLLAIADPGRALAATPATCAQFHSQAAAQHAVDSGKVTIADPDHDGRICVISPR